MFKIKREPIDRYKEPGSYVGLVFCRDSGPDFIQWTILSYDQRTGKYTRSETSSDGSKFDVPYTLLTYSHGEIRNMIYRGSWKLFKQRNYG